MRLEIQWHITTVRQGRSTTVRVVLVEGTVHGGVILCRLLKDDVDFVVVGTHRLGEVEVLLDNQMSATFRLEPRSHGNMTIEFELMGEESCPKANLRILVTESAEKPLPLSGFIRPSARNGMH